MEILWVNFCAISFLVLHGPGIESEHCIFESIEGNVTIHPIAEENSVNGTKVKKSLRLSQGKKIVQTIFNNLLLIS